jgi:hypothetical protein
VSQYKAWTSHECKEGQSDCSLLSQPLVGVNSAVVMETGTAAVSHMAHGPFLNDCSATVWQEMRLS